MTSDGGRFQTTIRLQSRSKGLGDSLPLQRNAHTRLTPRSLSGSCHLITDEVVQALGDHLKNVKVRSGGGKPSAVGETLVVSPRTNADIASCLPPPFQIGMLHLFIQHTSAAITLNENYDPDVRTDMDRALDKIVPESFDWLHTDEGPDDSVSHLKTTLVGPSLQIPIGNGKVRAYSRFSSTERAMNSCSPFFLPPAPPRDVARDHAVRVPSPPAFPPNRRHHHVDHPGRRDAVQTFYPHRTEDISRKSRPQKTTVELMRCL
jgi:secondary thiamine-phosphate synthase enzyme